MSNVMIEAVGQSDSLAQYTMRWNGQDQQMLLIGVPPDCGPDDRVCDRILEEVDSWRGEPGIDYHQRIVVVPKNPDDAPVADGQPLSLAGEYTWEPDTLDISSAEKAAAKLADLWKAGKSPVCLLARPVMDAIGAELKGKILAKTFSSSVRGLGEFTIRASAYQARAGTTFTVRGAEPADAFALVVAHTDSLITSYPQGTVGITQEAMWRRYFQYHTAEPRTIEDQIHYWQAIIDDPEQKIFVAVDDASNCVIGFSYAAVHENGEKWLDGLYVATDYQTRKVGTYLARAVLAHHGNDAEVRLETGSHLAAYRFYKHLGFEDAGAAPDIEPQANIMVRNDRLMIRKSKETFPIRAILRRHRYKDAHLYERLWVSGVRTTDNRTDLHYISDALVPHRHVRKLTPAELRDIETTPETPSWATVELVHFTPQQMKEIHRIVYEQRFKHGPIRGLEGREPVMLPGNIPAVFCDAQTITGGQLTSTKIEPRIDRLYSHEGAKRVGGHFDNWYQLPVTQRRESPQLLVVCLQGERYGLTMAGPDAVAIGGQLYPKDEEHMPDIRDLHAYYASPDDRKQTRFYWASLRAGEGYVINPEVIGHEGSTLGVPSSSVIAFFHLRDGNRRGRWSVDAVFSPVTHLR